MSKRQAGPRLRRTWPQRLLIALNILMVMVALAAATLIGFANKRLSETARVRLGDTLVGVGALAPTTPQNYLLVGTDSDVGLAVNDPVRQGRDTSVSGLRSDTIMVLRIDPASQQATILSFPRDLWVDIPGKGSQRINAAIDLGNSDNPNDPGAGQRLLVQTIKKNFQVDINHYVQVNFAGFKGLVRLLGGVKMYFATPVRDLNSGLAVNTAGCVTLDDTQALGLARSRHYQALIGGLWRKDPQSDLTRIKRQQIFLRKVLVKAIAQGARDPFTLKGLIDTASKNVQLDETLKPNDLIALGERYRSFNPDTLKTDTLDVSEVVRGGAQVLDLMDTPHNRLLLAEFQGAGSSAGSSMSPGVVRVQVLNGSGVRNQASNVTLALGAAGFQTVTPGPDPGSPGPQTVVQYPAGQELQAQLVARYLAPAVKLVPSASVAQVTVVTSTDFTGTLAQPKPADQVPVSTTTTTAPPQVASTAPPAGTAPPTTVDPFVPQTPPGVECA